MKGTFENSSPFVKLCLSALIIFLCALVAASISAVYMLLTINPTSPDNMRIMLLLQNGLIFIGSPLIAQYFLWKAPLQQALQLRLPSFSLIVWGCLVMLVSTPLIDMLNTWNQGLHLPESMKSIEQWMITSEQEIEALTKELLNVNTWGNYLMNILVIAIVAGVGEELLFRGVLQKIFIRWTRNVHIGILITAIIFSAMHLQFFGFMPRLVLGMLLGYLFIWSKSLWVPIIAHAFNNTLVIILSPNTFNHGNEIMETIENTENNIVYILVSIVLTAGCLYKIRRHYLSSAN